MWFCGCLLSSKAKLKYILFNDLAKISILAYDKTCANIHANIRADARKSGKTLAFADSQIAAIALAHDAVLVTRNVNDFSGIDGLKVENWFA